MRLESISLTHSVTTSPALEPAPQAMLKAASYFRLGPGAVSRRRATSSGGSTRGNFARVVHARKWQGDFRTAERRGQEEARCRGRLIDRRLPDTRPGQVNLETSHVLCRCRVGRAVRESCQGRDVAAMAGCRPLADPATVMSPSMRRRNGLMDFSLISVSCLEVGVLERPLDPRDGAPRPSPHLSWRCDPSPSITLRAPLSRVCGFVR